MTAVVSINSDVVAVCCQDLELTVGALLGKTGDSNRFIREDADKSLDAMVNNVSPARALAALIHYGVGYVNVNHEFLAWLKQSKLLQSPR